MQIGGRRLLRNKELIAVIKEAKGQKYITNFPISELEDIKQFEQFVKDCKKENIGVYVKYETSNFYCGVFVSLFDIETCEVKERLIDK